MHSLKQYVFLKILIENKAFYFSNRALRAVKTRNKWLKKPVVQNIFYSKYSVDFRKILVKKKNVLMVTKVSYGSVESYLKLPSSNKLDDVPKMWQK